MKLSKMSDQFKIDWLSINPIAKLSENCIKHASVNKTASDQVDELTISEECDKIETLANKEYFINKNWDVKTKDHLKEYALACGVNKIIEAEVETPEIKKASVEKPMVKTASVANATNVTTLNIGDPFRLDEKLNAPEREVNNWQENKRQANLRDRPSINSGIIPIRGGENTNIHNDPKLANNQNSLSNPNRIEELINSNELDTGARLAMEKQQKEEQKLANNKAWEQGKIEAMPKLNIVSKGLVFPTESLNANPGTNSALSKRIENNFNPNTVEDKTLGEQLKTIMADRKNNIQRQDQRDKSWEQVGEIKSARAISDSFTESLKKALKKG